LRRAEQATAKCHEEGWQKSRGAYRTKWQVTGRNHLPCYRNPAIGRQDNLAAGKRGDVAKPDISAMSDDELAAMIEQVQALLATRKEQRKAEAVAAARARLAEVGLTFRDVAASPARRAGRGQSPAASRPTGLRYINPADPSQVWVSGRGRRPDWVKALEKKGQLPNPQ
jgi:DNA-binding protein H-NS